MPTGLSRGDALPSFTFHSPAGPVVHHEDLQGSVSVLAFIATESEAGVELVARLEEAQQRIGDNAATFIVATLDGGPRAEQRIGALRSTATPVWTIVSAPAADVLDIAARFGAVVWSDGDHLEQVAAVAVIDDKGLIRELYHGLDAWTPSDLTAAIAALAH